MSPSQLALILKARWKSALIVFLLILTCSTSITLLLPKQYTATTSLLISPQASDPVSSVLSSTGGTVSSVIATELDVIQSERVLRRAIKNSDLENDTSLNDRWQKETRGKGDFQSWVAVTLRRSLDLRPTRDSKVISLAFSSPSPEFAALMANSITDAYVFTTTDLRVEQAKRYSEFFDERTLEMRNSLEKAQGRLSEFQRRVGVLIPDERVDTENARLAELSSQVVALQALVADSENRQLQASDPLNNVQEVLGSPVVVALSSEIAREEAKLGESRARFGEKHPVVIEQKARLETLKGNLKLEGSKVASSLNASTAVNLGRLNAVKAALEQQRSRVLRMTSMRDEAAVLRRDVENAQRLYDTMLNKASQSTMESQNNQPTVSVLQNATPPAAPSAPKFVLNVVLGTVLGVLLGVGFSIIRELTDRRVRCSTDLNDIVGIRVLGTLSKTKLGKANIESRIKILIGTQMTGRRRNRILTRLSNNLAWRRS